MSGGSAMKILIVDENQYERQTIAQMLGQAGFTVEDAKDPKLAVAALEREPVQVVVFGWPKTGGSDLVKRLRSFDSAHRTYLLALLDKQLPSEITALFAAGVDDFMRRPLVKEELLGRVEAPVRIERWATADKKAAFDWSAATDLRHLRACRDMGSVVAEEIGQMLGQQLQVTPGWAEEIDEKSCSATIPLSLASVQTEVRVTVVIEATSMPNLAGALLGDPNAPREALDDIVREISNIAGGAVKRLAMTEDVTLTTGLPVSGLVSAKEDETTRCWVARLAEPKLCIGIVGEVRRRENQRVAASLLKEGMVVAADLFSDTGALVVRAGTRLSATTAARVATILGHRFVVEVACAA
jgi:DNA-binding response OmpR family regulator